jgi:hypothetical protein
VVRARPLGSGYGDLKPSSVRVANFPAIGRADMERLIAALAVVDG